MVAPPEAVEYQSPAVKPRGSSFRTIVLCGLLALGVQLWLLTDFWLVRSTGVLATYAAAIVIAFVPAVQRALAAFSAWLAPGRSAWRTAAATLAISVAVGVGLFFIERGMGRQFPPIIHDEFSYLLQARMLAEGHLWLPAHPLGAFFDTFYVITDRAYASQYFPGAAAMFVPGALLNWAPWMMPLCLSAMACGAAFLVLRELFGASAAVAGVVVIIGTIGFRTVALSVLAQVPAFLLAMIAFWALLRWDTTRRLGWVALAGAAMGWFAVTRPLDAAVFGACGAAFVGWRLRGAPPRAWARVAVAGLLPLVPFCAVQLFINHGVTGRWLQTPFSYYLERDMPGTELGFHTFDPTLRPASTLPQKVWFFDQSVAKAARTHTPSLVLRDWIHRRMKVAVSEMFPDMLLLAVVPAGLMAMRDARRWMVVAAMPLWWVAYSFHPFDYFHYYVVLIPSMLVLVLAGVEAIARARPSWAPRVYALGVTLPIAISLCTLPIFRRDILDQLGSNAHEPMVRAAAATAPEPRIIVLVRFASNAESEQEVVSNVERAWPDDNRAIRAHDLGEPRNGELYRYYAERQPDRVVYRFDRGDGSFTRLGSVVDLARASASPASAPATGATTRP